jgi:hypothetical protein
MIARATETVSCRKKSRENFRNPNGSNRSLGSGAFDAGEVRFGVANEPASDYRLLKYVAQRGFQFGELKFKARLRQPCRNDPGTRKQNLIAHFPEKNA